MNRKPNVNEFVCNLLITHLGFDDALLFEHEDLLKKAYDLMRDDFLKLIIDVKNLSVYKKIEFPALYFIGAVKNQLNSLK